MDLMRSREVANLVGVDITTFRIWCNQGDGPRGIRTPGGHWRFMQTDVDQWLRDLQFRPEPRPDRPESEDR